MSEQVDTIPTTDPSERLWRAIIQLDILAHDHDGDLHQPSEVIGVAYPDDSGDTIVCELDYWINGNDATLWPQIRTEVMADEVIGSETIRLKTDRRADIECPVPIEDIHSVLSMAERVELMLSKMQAAESGTQRWVR